MSKNSVEELLAELFTEDNSSSSTCVLNNSHVKNKELPSDVSFQNHVVSYFSSNLTDSYYDINDHDFEQLFRMKKNTVLGLQKEIEGLYSVHQVALDTNLLLCLWILGNTTPMHEVSSILGIAEHNLKIICKNYFRKIIALSSKYIVWPTPCEMITLENVFKIKYGFPRAIGAIGCLHIAVQVSEDTLNCTEYFNMNTGNYTVVLQAVCDSNLLFRDIFIGYPGNNTVDAILRASPLNAKLVTEHSYMRRTKKHLLGGTEHPQLGTLLTPYPLIENRKLSERELRFNSIHGSAMLVVDKTFHSMENRFQRTKCCDSLDIEFATLAIGAICILHNFTRIYNDNESC